ncbi:MAG: S-methyl-5-thioribose-1-phosphate isomerase [Candidatus Omnitrophica bacterium]|nr:S-methyl-5-thioribose-1-phosphate isomerase [Candidatus Omnitrophota bacterium]
MAFPPLDFSKDRLKLLDQRKLPGAVEWLECRTAEEVVQAIRQMVVRGAPAIGVAAGYGLYLGIQNFEGRREDLLKLLEEKAALLKEARPTAVNLAWAVERVKKRVLSEKSRSADELKIAALQEAEKIREEDDRLCRAIGKHGARLFKAGETALTHCNAGGLATSGYGTALAVFYTLQEEGKAVSVYATETRPLLQGARLTAWELTQSRIPVTLVCESSVASLMRAGKIKRVVVGADRIAANGDTANKIGTYGIALLAKAHQIPFYIAAPSSTFDFSISSGKKIPIENRSSEEITEGFGKRTAPAGIRTENPAFDVTPHKLIAAFITEKGVLNPPYSKSLKVLRLSNDS